MLFHLSLGKHAVIEERRMASETNNQEELSRSQYSPFAKYIERTNAKL